MDYNEAISKISEIHSHLSKTEIFKGYRPFTLSLIGISSFIFALLQNYYISNLNESDIIFQWSIFAGFIFIVVTLSILYNCYFIQDSFEVHKSKKVLLQFLPSILAGLIITILFYYFNSEYLSILPGLWSIIFSLGIFSIRIYLPFSIVISAFYYLIIGIFLLLFAKYNLSLRPLIIGSTFGIGHFLTAILMKIYLNRNTK